MARGTICLEKPRNVLEFSVRTIFFLRVLRLGQHIAIRPIKVRTREPILIRILDPWAYVGLFPDQGCNFKQSQNCLFSLYFPRHLPCGAINCTPIA